MSYYKYRIGEYAVRLFNFSNHEFEKNVNGLLAKICIKLADMHKISTEEMIIFAANRGFENK